MFAFDKALILEDAQGKTMVFFVLEVLESGQWVLIPQAQAQLLKDLEANPAGDEAVETLAEFAIVLQVPPGSVLEGPDAAAVLAHCRSYPLVLAGCRRMGPLPELPSGQDESDLTLAFDLEVAKRRLAGSLNQQPQG